MLRLHKQVEQQTAPKEWTMLHELQVDVERQARMLHTLRKQTQ